MADVKEKINLLDVIPFRSENITAEKGSDGTVTIAFPRFKYEWMRRFLLPKGMSADIHVRLEDHFRRERPDESGAEGARADRQALKAPVYRDRGAHRHGVRHDPLCDIARLFRARAHGFYHRRGLARPWGDAL